MADTLPHESVRIVLDSPTAVEGIGLAVFGRVLDSLSDALRQHARARRGEPTRRLGTTSAHDEAVTDLRVVRVEPGSVDLLLRPPPVGDDEVASGEHASLFTFRSLISDARAGSLEPDVIDALDRGLSALGDGGTISFRQGDDSALVDREGLKALRAAREQEQPRPLRIVGRLRALDLDRTKIMIRTTAGLQWLCVYDESLTPRVVEAINRVVVARGTGNETGGGRGRVKLEHLEVVPESVQTTLFDIERQPLDRLIAAQGVSLRLTPIVPWDATEEEADALFDALGRV